MIRRLLLALLLAVTAAHAGAGQHVTVSAALESPSRPGATVWAAIHQSIEPGWHTYWRNPGETGEATALTWHLPHGVSAGDIAWPTPQTFSDGQVVSYGYSGEATLLVPLTASHDAEAGRARVDVFLLECEHVCIPFQATLDLDLNAASGAPALFRAARAALPRPLGADARVHRDGPDLVVTISSAALAGINLAAAKFYPAVADIVDSESPASLLVSAGTITWRAPLLKHAKTFHTFDGVLVVPGVAPFAIRAVPSAPAPLIVAHDVTLLAAMLMGLLGGLILNLMPCVLPILSMKALALARSGSTAALRRDGLFYFAGVLGTFAVIAGILFALKAGGAALGWGFQLQSPAVVLVLMLLMGAIGLNLLGAFELPLAAAGVGEGLTRREGGAGAFFTGALAVIVASPCTAPFMGTALGYALGQPPLAAAMVFLALGTGFALPFTALAFAPGLVRLIPKPGPWMVRFRQALAFPMFATAIWLLWVLGRQTGVGGMAWALAIALGLGFFLWLSSVVHRRARAAIAATAGAAAIFAALQLGEAADAVVWRPWSPGAVEAAQRAGHPVLVDFSAAWCVTCLVNERSTLDDPEVIRRLRRGGIVALKADWTNHDASIAAELGRFGRSGVPLYLLYPGAPGSRAAVLPQILTPALLTRAVDAMEARSPAHG